MKREAWPLHAEVTRRTVSRLGVKVAPCGCDRFMAQGRLHKVDRAASVEGVAGVGVSKPVGTDPRPNPGPPSSDLNDAEDLRGVEMTALAGAKNGSVGVGAVTQARKFLPRCGGKQNYPRLLALSANGDLPSITPLLSVAPGQRA